MQDRFLVVRLPRKEKDSFGEKEVPDNAYYGVHTMRSVENFRISGKAMPQEYIAAAARIKKACCSANLELGLLGKEKAAAILKACDEVAAGRFADQFPIDVFQAGSGTSTNMNLNEVVANRACELLGKEKGSRAVHPNDDVNMGQSTNDVTPAAIRVACTELSGGLLAELDGLVAALGAKAEEFAGALKAGRTHLQDAVPVTLGQEFGAYAAALEKDKERISYSVACLKELGIGGNAVGTGINTVPEFRGLIIKHLNGQTGIDFRQAKDGLEATQFLTDVAAYSSSLKLLALDLGKIANDLRLLSSGPRTGLAEIRLPPVEPGSSIMPGKINPSIAEAVNMACMQAMGNDLTVQAACAAGQLELNTHMPVIALNAIESTRIMTGAMKTFTEKCVRGIKADTEKMEWYVQNSAALATALNPILGYDKVAELVKESLAKNRPIKEIILDKGLLSRAELDKKLDPKMLTRSESKAKNG